MKIFYNNSYVLNVVTPLKMKYCNYVNLDIYMLLAVSKPLVVLIPLQGLEMAWLF